MLWYLGDNRLTQDPEDVLTDSTFRSPSPTLSVAERQQYLTIAVRDYLNEGGKLALAGETTAYYGVSRGALGGIYYGLDGAPKQDCVVTVDSFADCLLLADDFTQYWLGAYDRTPVGAARRRRHGARSTASRPSSAVRRRRQPGRRGGCVHPDERRAAGRGVPAVRELGARPSTSTRRSVHPDRGRVGGGRRPTSTTATSA